jgi:hypothetical protein
MELKKTLHEANGHVKESMPTLLVYLRELGSMALLGLVLYGGYDLAKTQGRDLVEVLESLRATIENQSNIQKEVLKSIQMREARRAYEEAHPNWSRGIQPPSNPGERRTQ